MRRSRNRCAISRGENLRSYKHTHTHIHWPRMCWENDYRHSPTPSVKRISCQKKNWDTRWSSHRIFHLIAWSSIKTSLRIDWWKMDRRIKSVSKRLEHRGTMKATGLSLDNSTSYRARINTAIAAFDYNWAFGLPLKRALCRHNYLNRLYLCHRRCRLLFLQSNNFQSSPMIFFFDHLLSRPTI